MANKTLTELTSAAALDGTENVYLKQSGNSRKGTTSGIRDFILTDVDRDFIPDTDGTRSLGSDPSSSGKAWAVSWAVEYGDGDGNKVSGQYITSGTVKVHANLNGTGTISLRDSFGISSATDNGTGDYTLNNAVAFANANYTPLALSGRQGSSSVSAYWAFPAGTISTTALQLRCGYNPTSSSLTSFDMYLVAAGAIGDI